MEPGFGPYAVECPEGRRAFRENGHTTDKERLPHNSAGTAPAHYTAIESHFSTGPCGAGSRDLPEAQRAVCSRCERSAPLWERIAAYVCAALELAVVAILVRAHYREIPRALLHSDPVYYLIFALTTWWFVDLVRRTNRRRSRKP